MCTVFRIRTKMIITLHFKPRCSLKEGFHDSACMIIFVQSQSFNFKRKSSSCRGIRQTPCLGKHLVFIYLFDVPKRGYALKKINIKETFFFFLGKILVRL